MTEARLYCFADSREIPPTFGSSGTDGCMSGEEASFFPDALLKMAYSNSDASLFSYVVISAGVALCLRCSA